MPIFSSVSSVAGWILREEGGVADVGDGAGLTKWGQTAGWLAKWSLPSPTTKEEAEANYLKWLDLSRIGLLFPVEPLLCLVVADYAINSGEEVAVKALQEACGAAQDGIIGPLTLKAASLAPLATAHVVVSYRVEHFGTLLAHSPTSYSRFARGWMARMGRQIRLLGRVDCGPLDVV